MRLPVLSFIVFLPTLAALGLAAAGPAADRRARPVALIASAACFVVSVVVVVSFALHGTAFAERAAWFPQVGITYILGIDGLSVFMLLLSTGMVLMAVWLSPAEPARPRLYYGLLLVLATGLYGVFSSLDLVLFYVFWEAVFIPIYFIISIWGEPGASRAALKFLVYMFVGSLVMLLGVVGIYFASPVHTFDLAALAATSFPVAFQRLAFAAFFIGFAVKIPIFPFHVWLPDAYTFAPTPLTVLMAASLAAMGVYGFWRIPMTLLPEGFRSFGGLVAVLAVVGILYGDLCATVQRDLKRMTAYSSISHMGFVTLGAVAGNALGVRGSILHTFNHGVAMAALFFAIEYLYSATGSRNPTQVHGLMAAAPLLATGLWLASLASYGLPGLATFPGELTILLGSYARYPLLALMALSATVIMAGYIFWVLSRVTFGSTDAEPMSVGTDLVGKNLGSIWILGTALVVLGVAPVLITGPISSSVKLLVARVAGA